METKRRLILGRTITFAVIGDGIAAHYWVDPERTNGHWASGIELHRTPREGEVWNNPNCWLLEGPCCHDGSSLYAMENITPRFIECITYARNGDDSYEPVWRMVEQILKRNAE